MSAEPIYVVVMATGGKVVDGGDERGGPIVMEAEVDGATLDFARERAALLERRYGACRVARLVFEDHPAFNPATA
jgi:hypothetical protein